MSLDGQVAAFAGEAKRKRAQVKRQLAGFIERTSDVRALFLDEHGDMREEAVRFFADMSRLAHPVSPREHPLTDIELREAAGAQRLLHEILSRLQLSSARLQHFRQRLAALERGST